MKGKKKYRGEDGAVWGGKSKTVKDNRSETGGCKELKRKSFKGSGTETQICR